MSRNLKCSMPNGICNLLSMPQGIHSQRPLIWVSITGKTTATCMYKQASKQANKQASKQASEQASKQASKQASQASKQASKPASQPATKQSKQVGCTCLSSAILSRLSSFFLRLDCLFASDPTSLSLSPSSASGYSTDNIQLSNHAETPLMLMCNTCSSHSLADRLRQVKGPLCKTIKARQQA